MDSQISSEAGNGLLNTAPFLMDRSMGAAPRRTQKIRTLTGAARDESRLVERLKAGDEAALKAIFDRYAPRLYNVAQRILGEMGDAEEVIQDVFWIAFRKARSFMGNSKFSTWLYRLTVNAALGKLRRSKRAKEISYEDYFPKFQEDGRHHAGPVLDWSETLEERFARREIQALIGAALDRLKPLDRSVVVLSDIEGLSDKEIAAAVGSTVSAVKTRLHRARLELREQLAATLGCRISQ